MNKKKEWPSKVFVSGIHTDAGKSYATGWLARKIIKEGGSATTMKFVQTGNSDFSEDIAVHRKVMGIEPTVWDQQHITAPQIFSYPCSPDLAARIDSRKIDFKQIDEAADILADEYGTVLIEGAGGLMVPLEGNFLTIDYVKERNLPLVLVTNGSLGSINHTLLSLYAIKHYDLDLLAVIYNSYFDTDKIIAEDTRKYIKDWLKTHFMGTSYLEMEEIKP